MLGTFIFFQVMSPISRLKNFSEKECTIIYKTEKYDLMFENLKIALVILPISDI